MTLLAGFVEKRIVSDERWCGVTGGIVRAEYRNSATDEFPVAYIEYSRSVGQIRLIVIKEMGHRGRGLGKQMLARAIVDIVEFGNVDAKSIWAVTTKNHQFWSNIWNKSFKWQSPAHRSVTGSGYSMPI